MQIQKKQIKVRIGDKDVILKELSIAEYQKLEEKFSELLIAYGNSSIAVALELLSELTELDVEYLREHVSLRQAEDLIFRVLEMSLPETQIKAIQKIRDNFFQKMSTLLLRFTDPQIEMKSSLQSQKA